MTQAVYRRNPADRHVEVLGEWMTLTAASRVKGTTDNALRLWLRRHGIPVTVLGKSILVRFADLDGYTSRSGK